MITDSAKTSYFDRGSEPTGVMMSLDWMFGTMLGRGLGGRHHYSYSRNESTKAIYMAFFGAPNVSTRSADGELAHGRNNWDVRSNQVLNMDTLQLKLSDLLKDFKWGSAYNLGVVLQPIH